MTPERWQQIGRIFKGALERERDRRAAFLRQACGSDSELRRQVEALLSSHEQAGSFMEAPPSTVTDLTEPRTTVGSAHGESVDLFLGRVVSNYRLEERLAAGGMGVLYRATDLKLGRSVAVKVLSRHLALDETARARFLREARAASALDHPNIGAIYHVEDQDRELFIVMALYRGETLKQRLEKGPLALPEALEVLRQVALGLEAAHGVGIIHRDIKPANLIRTDEGTVKILDFGLAKLTSQSQPTPKTQTGEALGTVLYMSPEQLRGTAVDARSDLWSLGVVAYELLAGVSPFQADSGAATAMRILNEKPPGLASVPGVPPWLAKLVTLLLRKAPAERPQSATEVLEQLEQSTLSDVARPTLNALSLDPDNWSKRGVPFQSHAMRRATALLIGAIFILGAVGLYLFVKGQARSPGGSVKSLVVLPFVNASANAEMEYLSDGISETLIDNLSQLPDLKVIARDTAFGYKGKAVDPQELGRELSVDTVLTGRVEQRGDTLFIHAGLVNVVDRSQLWGEKYNRKFTDLLAVEEEIAKAISDKLQVRFSSMVRRSVAKRSTDNPVAYQLYLRGRYFWNMRTKEYLSKSIEYFQQAIDLDHNYALAYAGLADSYQFLIGYSTAPREENFAKAEAAALRALAIDDELAEAHATLGNVAALKWDWLTAKKEFKRAIDLKPNYALAHNWYGLYLKHIAHSGEAVAEFTRAQELDPASAISAANLGNVFCQRGEYDQGIARLRDAEELNPKSAYVHFSLGASCYLPRNMYQEAIDEFEKELAINSTATEAVSSSMLAYTYARLGNKDRALSVLKQLKERDQNEDLAVPISLGYIGLNEEESAFEWLEKAYQRRSPGLLTLKVDHAFDSLRSDPRFADLVRRIGFPP